MKPGHGSDSSEPFPIDSWDLSDFNKYGTPDVLCIGREVEIAYDGPAFKGIMIEIRDKFTGEAEGQWTIDDENNFKTIDCFDNEGSTVTHANNRNKTTFRGTWSSTKMGEYEMYVTMLPEFTQYWSKVSIYEFAVVMVGACESHDLPVIINN